MCTTACVCMSILSISNLIDLKRGDDRHISKCVQKVMSMASMVHGKIENRIADIVHQNEPHKRKRVESRMVGLWEVFSLLELSPEKIGIATEELVVCRLGEACNLKMDREEEKEKAEAIKRPMLYKSDSCFIRLTNLPKCMEQAPGFEKSTVACVITCGGHSLCVILQDGVFALFDPMPSSLHIGMSALDLVREIERNRGFSSARGDPVQCDTTLLYHAKPVCSPRNE